MEQFNKTPTTGKFGEIAKVIDTNFGLVLTKLMELELRFLRFCSRTETCLSQS